MGSRLTFRSASELCYQRQRRDAYNDEGAPPGVDLSLAHARVEPVTYAAARQIILKYEWLGKMGAGVSRNYGIFFGMYCAGVTSWAPAGKNLPQMHRMFGLADGSEVGYLARGACVHWAPPGTNSKLVAYSLRFEKKRGTKIAVAFADDDAGEIGTIYQAANWTYIGRSAASCQYAHPNGATRSNQQLSLDVQQRGIDRKRLHALLLAEGWVRQRASAKYRYVYVLNGNEDLQRRVDALTLPYPKRAKQAMADPTAQRGSVTHPPAPESAAA
jgi:hypothetical protein